MIMSTVEIPRHTHVNYNGSICEVPTAIFPEVIHGCPMALHGVLRRLQHLPMILIPVIGLIYAGIFCYRYTKAQADINKIYNFTPNGRCPECRNTFYTMWSPIIFSILGGLGLMTPLLILLIPIFLIVGLAKAFIGLGTYIVGITKCCLKKNKPSLKFILHTGF
ncbi:putative inner membrane protein [Chlamydia abortus]|nr:putative inner membrane protein [Chlamydia abortus]